MLPSLHPCLLGIQSVEVQLEKPDGPGADYPAQPGGTGPLEGTGRQAVLKGMGSGLSRE